MRYILLIIGILLTGWGFWTISGNADKEAIHVAELCGQILTDNSSWVKCSSDAYAHADKLKTYAVWSIIFGLVFVLLSSLAIYGSYNIQTSDTSDSEDI